MCVASSETRKKAAKTAVDPTRGGGYGAYYTLLKGGAVGKYGLDPIGKKIKEDKKVDSPPPVTTPETTATTGRSKELAVQTAKAREKKRLALRGRRRTILTSGQGVLGAPDIYRKRLLGQ